MSAKPVKENKLQRAKRLGKLVIKPKKVEEPVKPKKKKLVIKEKPKAPAKKEAPKGIDYDNVETKLDTAFINNYYPDWIEMFLDGKGSEDKQLERASGRVGNAITRLLKRTVKKQKFKTDKELIDYWIKNKSKMGEEL